MGEEPVSRDLRNGSDGPYWVDWYCDPPPEGAVYEVTREQDGGWRRGHPVRAVYEVRVTGGLPRGQVVTDAGELPA